VPPDAVSSLAGCCMPPLSPDALTVWPRCGYGQVRTAFDEDAASATGRTELKVGPVLMTAVTKEKPGFWTRRRAFDQVRHGSNIQLLSYSLVGSL
jgi:hypothetical protein